jgi:N utilization substance protein B
MNRYKQREQALLLIFESLFTEREPNELIDVYTENIEEVGDYSKQLFLGVFEKKDELDNIISEFSTGWKLSRISKVNLAVLRLALYEITYVDDVPESVAINEAVELTKKYASKEDAAFVNGILGSYFRSRN